MSALAITVTVTAEQIFATGAFDNMMTGSRYTPSNRIGAIKIVRQITGQDLYTVKRASDDRMLAMEQASTDAILAGLRKALCEE